jgi:hypothetical protein
MSARISATITTHSASSTILVFIAVCWQQAAAYTNKTVSARRRLSHGLRVSMLIKQAHLLKIGSQERQQ